MKTARTKGVTKRRKTGMLTDVLLGNKKQQLQSADHEKKLGKDAISSQDIFYRYKHIMIF